MTEMREPVILEAVRTPFAKAGGAFREVRPDALLAHTLDGLLERAGLDAEMVEDVVNGTVTQAGEHRPARRAARGLPCDGARGKPQPHVRLQPAGGPLRLAGRSRWRHKLRHRLGCGEHDSGADVQRHR